MKKHCIGLVACMMTSVAALASANAADLAPKYKAPVVYPTWAGLYIGGFVGGAWDNLHTDDINEFPGSWGNRGSAVFGGGTIGYNAQVGNLVYGVEGDIGGFGLKHTGAQPLTRGVIQSQVDTAFYFDATARLGYTWDKALLYAKGGAAFHDGNLSAIDVGEASVTSAGILGWTIGAGIEYKLAPQWSVKAEYQFFDFGTNSVNMPDGDRYDLNYQIHTVKAGVNYHF